MEVTHLFVGWSGRKTYRMSEHPRLNMKRRQGSIKKCYDRKRIEGQEIYINDKVIVYDLSHGLWIKGLEKWIRSNLVIDKISPYIRSSFKLIRTLNWLSQDHLKKVNKIPLKYIKNESKNGKNVANPQDSSSDSNEKNHLSQRKVTSVKHSTELSRWFILNMKKEDKKP